MSKIDPEDPTGGNIITPVVKKKQIAPAKKWCFTLNNWTLEDVENLKSANSAIVQKIHFTDEVGEETGTPHLQGWIEFTTRKRPIKVLGKILGHERTSFQKMRGSIQDNIAYCNKDLSTSTISYSRGLPTPIVLMERADMRANQLEIADRYIEDENPKFGRKIHWYWEREGGWGKSILTKYMVDQMGALVLSGMNKDCLHGVASIINQKGECPRIIIFDIPKINRGHLSYQALESIKNGCFFSPKYEGIMVRFNSPHIIVFSNEHPDIESLSEDRWVIEELGGGSRLFGFSPNSQVIN